MDITDDEILNLFLNQDTKKQGFDLLVKKYREPLYWHIRKLVINHFDTDDILQNTFIKVFKNLAGFRSESKLFTWLYRIATNESINFLNKQRKKYFLPIVDVEKKLLRSLKDDEYFNGDEIQLKLQKAILSLPEKQRIIFNMKYFDDLKYEDMAEILNTSVGALKASYHHAVKKIEAFMKTD